MEKAEKLVKNMVRRAIEAEGTCTGEHGVGYGKKDGLIQEVGEDTITVMVSTLDCSQVWSLSFELIVPVAETTQKYSGSSLDHVSPSVSPTDSALEMLTYWVLLSL